MNGPRFRTDIVDVYVFRTPNDHQSDAHRITDLELLQLRRTRDPMAGQWHPVMGHAEAGENAVACARRELHEEITLDLSAGVALGFWALEQVHPFFIAEMDCIIASPRFAVRVPTGWEPTLNDEHDAHRWTPAAEPASFVWPGQHAAIAELLAMLTGPAPREPLLRLPLND